MAPADSFMLEFWIENISKKLGEINKEKYPYLTKILKDKLDQFQR